MTQLFGRVDLVKQYHVWCGILLQRALSADKLSVVCFQKTHMGIRATETAVIFLFLLSVTINNWPCMSMSNFCWPSDVDAFGREDFLKLMLGVPAHRPSNTFMFRERIKCITNEKYSVHSSTTLSAIDNSAHGPISGINIKCNAYCNVQNWNVLSCVRSQ